MNHMIRPYRSEDLGEVLELWHKASRIAHPFLTEAFLEKERAEIAERWLPVAETVVNELQETVVGFLALIGNEVGAIFVDPRHQGNGVGQALMDHARASREFLELDVFEANPIGRKFYEAYGFQLIGRHVHEETRQPQLRLMIHGESLSATCQ